VRSVGGLVVWGLSGRFERATLKLIDGLTATVTWLGYAFGDNGA
jgi:hypothetical protein